MFTMTIWWAFIYEFDLQMALIFSCLASQISLYVDVSMLPFIQINKNISYLIHFTQKITFHTELIKKK